MKTQEMIKAQFTQAEVLEATGMEVATLQTWVNRRVVTPASGLNPGQGAKRLYSAYDAVWLALLNDLTTRGVPISVATQLCGHGDFRPNGAGEYSFTAKLMEPLGPGQGHVQRAIAHTLRKDEETGEAVMVTVTDETRELMKQGGRVPHFGGTRRVPLADFMLEFSERGGIGVWIAPGPIARKVMDRLNEIAKGHADGV